MAMSQFRRSVVSNTTNRGGKKQGGFGGGNKGAWHDRMKLPKEAIPFVFIANSLYVDPNPAPDLIEIDAATGKPKPVVNVYYKFRKHVRRVLRNGKEFYVDEICSAGDDAHNPQPCAGCMAMDSGDKSVSVKDVFAFGIIDLRPYHGHPLEDWKQPGSFVTKKDGTPFIIYDECTGRTCNYCRTLKGQQLSLTPGERWPNYPKESISTVFGKRRYFEVGKNHLADLVAWDQIVASQCAGFIKDANGNPVRRCGAQLIIDGYACPTCNNMVINMAEDPRTDEQIAQAVQTPYPCLTCQRPVLLQEVVSCDTCGNAVQESPFSGRVVLWGSRQGEKTASHLTLQKFESLESFGLTVPQNLLNGKTLEQHLQDLMKAYDFAEVFKPKSIEDQAKRLQLDLGNRGQQSGGYGAQPQQQSFVPVTPQAAPKGPGPAAFVPTPRPNFGNNQ